MAIKTIDFYNQLANQGVSFFAGVPDSLLKEFCLCIDDFVNEERHIITANEGNAIALATGYYLAKKSLPLVYMQNSGLGNAVNPLLSLCDSEVYSIPMLVMVGWRGEPGLKDEPQHEKQGKVQLELLEAMKLSYKIISKNDNQFENKISNAIETANRKSSPVVLLIKKGTFEKYNNKIETFNSDFMMREEALSLILENLDDDAIVVSTTGKTSREIFEIRKLRGQSHQQDFLTVGSMGHCSSIALGIAIAKPNRQVVCIDGDGSMLMHLGSLTSIASLKPKNFRHILMNNGVHDSVGGQSTAAKKIDLLSVVDAMSYSKIFKAERPEELKECIPNFMKCIGPSFMEIKIKSGSREDLGRPNIKPLENKKSFMKFLEK